MRKDEFVMRGQTASGKTEVLNFSGRKAGYAYRLVEFQLYPSTNIGVDHFEMCATITAGKTAINPVVVDFNDESLIASSFMSESAAISYSGYDSTVINDTFLITQNLILMVQDSENATPVNWQCRFKPVKVSGSEEAVANYKQFMISDGS